MPPLGAIRVDNRSNSSFTRMSLYQGSECLGRPALLLWGPKSLQVATILIPVLLYHNPADTLLSLQVFYREDRSLGKRGDFVRSRSHTYNNTWDSSTGLQTDTPKWATGLWDADKGPGTFKERPRQLPPGSLQGLLACLLSPCVFLLRSNCRCVLAVL